MPSDPPADKATLRIIGATPLTELGLRDALFRLVPLPENVGETRVALDPGIYTVEFREGRSLERRVVQVPTVGEVHQSVERPLDLRTPNIFARLHQACEVVQRRTGQSSSNSGASGAGGRVRVLVTGQQAQAFAQTLSLRLATGQTVTAPVEMIPEIASEPIASVLHDVPLGPCGLRLSIPQGPVLEMALVAVERYETRVFLHVPLPGAPFDVTCSSVALGRTDADWLSPRPRIAELALQALADGRTLHGRAMEELLEGKVEDPMLGLYGAHLLLRPQIQAPPRTSLRRLLDHLRSLLPCGGELHPDLAALELAVSDGRGAAAASVAHPPILRASWKILLEHSYARPDLVPPESMSDRVANRLWGDGAFLWWLVAAPGEQATPQMETARTVHIEPLPDLFDAPEDLEVLHGQPASPFFAKRSKRIVLIDDLAGEAKTKGDRKISFRKNADLDHPLSLEAMARDLGVPPSTALRITNQFRSGSPAKAPRGIELGIPTPPPDDPPPATASASAAVPKE